MKVAVYYNNNDIRIEERPVPKIGHREILVRIMASGICGSDVMEWYRIKTAPRVLGHEVAGFVEEAGSEVRRFKKGDRVFLTHHVPCLTCRWCLKGLQTSCETLHATNFDPGGFAQFVRVPEINVERGTLLLPDSVSFEEASFIEPLACVVRGFRLARFTPPENVLVLGSGIAGILSIALAHSLGAGRIMATDINKHRLLLAKKFGAERVFEAQEDLPSRIAEANDGRLAEFVAVTTGAPEAFLQALQCVDRGGKVLFFAPAKPGAQIAFPLFEFWKNGASLTSSYGAAGKDLADALELIRHKRMSVQAMISHRLSLSEVQEGFKMVAEAGQSLKVIFEPQKI